MMIFTKFGIQFLTRVVVWYMSLRFYNSGWEIWRGNDDVRIFLRRFKVVIKIFRGGFFLHSNLKTLPPPPGGVNLWQIFVDPTPRSKIQKIRFSFTKIYFWYQNRILNTSRWSRRVGDVFSIDRIRRFAPVPTEIWRPEWGGMPRRSVTLPTRPTAVEKRPPHSLRMPRSDKPEKITFLKILKSLFWTIWNHYFWKIWNHITEKIEITFLKKIRNHIFEKQCYLSIRSSSS